DSCLDLLFLELPHRLAQTRPFGHRAFRAGERGMNLLVIDRSAWGHDDQPLHQVSQLADVAGEGVWAKGVERARRKPLLLPVRLLRDLSREMLDQERDILGKLAKGGGRVRNGGEPVVKIFTKI